MLNKYQSVKNFRGMKVHSGSTVRLSVKSSKFLNDVLHVKFDLQYFVTEMCR